MHLLAYDSGMPGTLYNLEKNLDYLFFPLTCGPYLTYHAVLSKVSNYHYMTLVKRDKKIKTWVSWKKSLLKIKTTMPVNFDIIKSFDFLLYFINFIYFIIKIVSINLLSIIKGKKTLYATVQRKLQIKSRKIWYVLKQL